jgi:protein-S-isoprenylcysteine O-methyltransferase Ste14
VIQRPERALDWLMAASIIGWGVMGLIDQVTPVRAALAALDLTVAVLLIRRRLIHWGALTAWAHALPAVIAGGAAFKFAAPPEAWAVGPTLLFGVGTAWTIVSLIALGPSFAVLPAVGQVRDQGPYGVLRHPAYLGELVMVGACVWGAPSWPAAIAGALVPALLIPRILAEERLLGQDPTYASYRERVRWRLLPGVW